MTWKLNVVSVKVLDPDEALDFHVNMGVRDPSGTAIRILRPAKAAREAAL